MLVRLIPPLKWWGGKSYLAKWIIDLMPRHLHYVEPYFGGGAVLLNKDPFDERHQWGNKSGEQGTSEVVNDINASLQNFWRVLQHEDSFARLLRVVEATAFSETEFAGGHTPIFPVRQRDIDAAAYFFVRCRQSRAGAFKDFATLSRNRTRRGMSEQASAWLTAIEGLPAVHSRLKRVVILCRDALDVIRQQDGPKTLFYLDPPYLHGTRASIDDYKHEMTEEQHADLLGVVRRCKGKVMLSGYHSRLYDKALPDWRCEEFKIDNKAAGGGKKRIMTECVWCNF